MYSCLSLVSVTTILLDITLGIAKVDKNLGNLENRSVRGQPQAATCPSDSLIPSPPLPLTKWPRKGSPARKKWRAKVGLGKRESRDYPSDDSFKGTSLCHDNLKMAASMYFVLP